jgi:hypothetical protein
MGTIRGCGAVGHSATGMAGCPIILRSIMN